MKHLNLKNLISLTILVLLAVLLWRVQVCACQKTENYGMKADVDCQKTKWPPNCIVGKAIHNDCHNVCNQQYSHDLKSFIECMGGCSCRVICAHTFGEFSGDMQLKCMDLCPAK